MTVYPTDLPLSGVPFDVKILARDVQEMKRALDLLNQRDELAAALSERGVDLGLDALKAEDIFELVARRHGITVARLRSRESARDVSWPRQEVFYLMSIQTKPGGRKRWSLTAIGRRVASDRERPFDHTTVLHGVRRHRDRIEAAKGGEPPIRETTGRPRLHLRDETPPTTKVAASVCMLPPELSCPGCGALGGEACRDGAERRDMALVDA